MLRNLNRTWSRGRICGAPHAGLRGALVPATGTHGPGYARNRLAFPADADVEIQGYITSVPVGLTIHSYEDTSFSASAADGTYVVPFDLYRNVVYSESSSFSLTFGAVPLVVSATPGNASAAGVQASVIFSGAPLVVSATPGAAVAAGVNASITTGGGLSVNATPGAATAAGVTATVTFAQPAYVIHCTPGAAIAAGVTARIALGQVVYGSLAGTTPKAQQDRPCNIQTSRR